MGDIGAGGEHFFMAFCSVEGVTANASHADKNGWDVFIEVEQSTSTITQGTLHEPLIAGTVQVKSTQTKSLKVDVSLSNLRKMATSPLPSFYVLMDFSEGPIPRRAFIRHVDEALISQILERVNAHLVAGKTEKLNKFNLRIDFGLGQEINLGNPSTFKSEVICAVGGSAASYTERKLQFLKTVGYDDGSHSMRFQIAGIENLESLVDAMLGLGGLVELQQMQFLSKRFGLEDPVTRRDPQSGALEVHPSEPVATGFLVFRDPATGASAQVQAALHCSLIHYQLPNHLKKMRFDCGTFDFLMTEDGSNSKFTTTLDHDKPFELDELCTLLQVMEMIRDPQDLVVEMNFNGRLAAMQMTAGTGLPSFAAPLRVAETLHDLKSLYRDRGSLMVTLNDLMRNFNGIMEMNAFLQKRAGAKIDLRIDGVFEPFEAVCLAPVSLVIGKKCYVAILAVTGEMTPVGNGLYSMQSTGSETLFKTVRSLEDIDEERFLEEIRPALERHSSAFPTFNLVPSLLKLTAPA